MAARTGPAVDRAGRAAAGRVVAAGRADLPLPVGADAGRGRGECGDRRRPAGATARAQPAGHPRLARPRDAVRDLAAPCAGAAARPSRSPPARTAQRRPPDRRRGRHALPTAALQRAEPQRSAARHRARLQHRAPSPRPDLFAQLLRPAQRRPRPGGDGRLHRGAARRPARRLRDRDLFARRPARPALGRRHRARPRALADRRRRLAPRARPHARRCRRVPRRPHRRRAGCRHAALARQRVDAAEPGAGPGHGAGRRPLADPARRRRLAGARRAQAHPRRGRARRGARVSQGDGGFGRHRPARTRPERPHHLRQPGVLRDGRLRARPS